MSTLNFATVILAVACIFTEVSGHGRMLKPIMRSSLWRYDSSAPINHNDNQLYCGGIGTQWNVNKGKCGVCGDSYSDRVPRQNENTGKYGQGKIVTNYTTGSEITVYIDLHVNHKGWFSYQLCELHDSSKPESEDCFQSLLFSDGSKLLNIPSGQKQFYNKVQLPAGLSCNHCVLRWTYRTANSWGTCEDGSGAMGCGPQETYKNCADVSIH